MSMAQDRTVAALVAAFLKERGPARVYGLQGGHIQPLWDELVRAGIPIVDVRDEGAAVHMAHAEAELTGSFGVALATAGPGVTNTVTALANTHVARIPLLLIGGCAPRPQINRGPLQDLPQVELLRPVTRTARTARVAAEVLRELDEACARAAGDAGEPGPAYIEIPPDVLRETVPEPLVLPEHVAAKPPRRVAPDPASLAAALDLLMAARRPLVVTGRGARGAGAALVALLDRVGAAYLDTQESRGLVAEEHAAFVGAMRAAAMREADLVLLVGRKLDYQLGYGSPAVFPEARFIRLADTAAELIDNRRGAVELFASPAEALTALHALAGNRKSAADRAWVEGLRAKHVERARRALAAMATAAPGKDGRMHPNRIFAALRTVLRPDAIGIADGGDILSFARVGLATSTYLDSGTLGCLGVGVPFAVAAALACPDRQVVSVNGDGAFGFNAIEVDTAVRHGAKAVFVVANNAAWNIERADQALNYGGRISGTELRYSDYAALGRALGAHGERVERPEDLVPALTRAFEWAPSVVDVVLTRDAVSSDFEKGLSLVPDLQALTAWDEAERRRRGGH
jgi:acetolactate synthase-1/2/3 large subunit